MKSLGAAGRALGFVCAASAALWIGSALAAPEEIVVFADEFEKPGQIGVDLHFNFASHARKTPDYPGEQPPDKILRLMPEVVWGLSPNWNLGLHVPASLNTRTGSATVDGFKARLHYLDSRRTEVGSVFHGANFELSYFDRRLSESKLVAEIRGILGVRRGDWMFAVNPVLNRPLDEVPGVDNRFNLDVQFKVMRHVGPDLAAGIEHYSELGRLSDLQFGPSSGQISYAVVEFRTRSDFEIQLGIGHGWTAPVDKRIYKLLLGIPF